MSELWARGLAWRVDGQPTLGIIAKASAELRPGRGSHRVIEMECAGRKLEITVSPQGRTWHVRVYDPVLEMWADMEPGVWA